MNMQRFISIIKKEFIQIKRDKASFGIAIMMPIVMMLLFGYSVTTELNNIPTAVLDQNHSKESREFIKSFENTGYFNITKEENNIGIIQNAMDSGLVHAAIIIPPDYSNKILRGEKPTVQFLIDGSDPTTARTVFSSGVLTGEGYGVKFWSKSMEKYPSKMSIGGVEVNSKVLYNPSLRNQNFVIPGLVGLIMQNITILLTAFALVREKERGTIEQLMVSPVTAPELILGKLVPYIVIGYLDFLFALALGVVWFAVPIMGSLPLLLLLGLGFVICALAIGILISSAAKTQLQAMQLSFLVLLPSILLSGFIFPRESMPKIVQFLGSIIPLTYFLNILRGIVLKGVGMEVLYKDVFILFSIGLVLLILSMVQFRKTLD